MIKPLLIALLVIAGCRKVPLIEQQGSMEAVSAHWFGNEGVAYVFFSLSEDPSLLQRSYWEMKYTLKTTTGGTERHDWQRVDFNAGVHLHEVRECGYRRICGSYSFKTALPLDSVSMKLNYDPESTLFLQMDGLVQAHVAGSAPSSHSAFLFGVFDETNEHVQARVHHNFGNPSSDEVPLYGMTRRFRVREPFLYNATTEQMTAENAKGNQFQFTPAYCLPAPAGAVATEFPGERGWLPDFFGTEGGQAGVCFTGEFLDKSAQPLFTGAGFARKNPEVGSSSYTFETPLKTAQKLSIVLRYCEDDAQFGAVTDQEFFNYQRFIVNVPEAPPDLCFKVGSEDQFKTAFTDMLSARLAAAKAANPEARDFVFVLVFHQNFSDEFRKFHQIIAEALSSQIDAESTNVSPRLVGAFVYDTRTDFRPTAAQRRGIIWCPQELPLGLPPTMVQPDGFDENCTVTPTANLDLTVINFVTPLGPFPSLSAYKKYVKKYGDRGTAHGPTLNFSSVPTGEGTRQETDDTVTFFDGERISVGEGEVVRLCLEKGDLSMIQSLRFRLEGTPDSQPSLSLIEAAALWGTGSAPGEYSAGVAWEFPFVGRVDYTSTLSGNVVAVVPFQRSSDTYKRLGDEKWLRQRWPVGDLLQVCKRFCAHPYFDESGAYQINNAWQTRAGTSCPAVIYPKFEAPA